jgi:hypothetical protein
MDYVQDGDVPVFPNGPSDRKLYSLLPPHSEFRLRALLIWVKIAYCKCEFSSSGTNKYGGGGHQMMRKTYTFISRRIINDE